MSELVFMTGTVININSFIPRLQKNKFSFYWLLLFSCFMIYWDRKKNFEKSSFTELKGQRLDRYLVHHSL